MYKQCQTEQSAQRQRQLEQGLLQCMLKRHYDEISVIDLCREMEIPRKSFYRYFSGKDGALFALIDHALMDYENFSVIDIRDSGMSALRYMEKMFTYWLQCKPLLDALAKSNLSGVLVQWAIAYSKTLESLPQFLVKEQKQLQDYGVQFAVSGLMSMLIQWHMDGFSQSVEHMAMLAIRLMSKPLFTNIEE